MNFRIKIVTPNKTIEKEIISLSFVAENGSMGILANHLPVVTTVRPGKISIVTNSGKNEYNVSKGLFKFDNNEALMLVEKMEGL